MITLEGDWYIRNRYSSKKDRNLPEKPSGWEPEGISAYITHWISLQ